MFTWIPIHEETAKRLLEFKDRSHELVGIIRRMHEAGLVALPIGDRDALGNEIPLKEIDPFTFLANFNRGIRDDNRIALWEFLRKEWDLKSEAPTDFDGLPVANKQNSRLIPWSFERDLNHVPDLWRFFEHIMTTDSESLDTGLMQRCLGYKCVGLAMLTMGMFWAQPEKWIASDRKNLGFAATKGVTGKVKTSADYVGWLAKAKAVCGDGVGAFSSQAHQWATGDDGRLGAGYGSPFNRMFPYNEADAALDVFADALEVITDEAPEHKQMLAFTFGSTSRAVPQLVLNIGMWAVLWYENRNGAQRFGFLLPANHPEITKQGSPSQFADTVDGNGYGHAKLMASEFFARYEELWPAISEALRVACRLFANRKGTPYLRFHRPELVNLASDVAERAKILREGFSMRNMEPLVTERGYWLIAPGEGARLWEQWQDQGIAAIGFTKIGDLSRFKSREELDAALLKQLENRDIVHECLMLWNISHEMRPGDIVFAKLGRSEVIGWGEVMGDYAFHGDDEEYPHVIEVDWKVKKAVKIPDRKLAVKTLTEITRKSDLLEILRGLYPGVPGLSDSGTGDMDDDSTDGDGGDGLMPEYEPYSMDNALAELFMSRNALEHVLEQLSRKRNIILQGAPGVGKTFIAKRLAWILLGVKNDSAVEMVQFHQSYTYEDFVQGLRPTKDGHFTVKDGCFYRLCRKALANPKQDYFLVIDEINRGNLSKILGELMMLIETDKRGETLTLAYSEEPFTVPPNLYLIGTMNTADRSLSLVDYALRRRFAFLTLDPGFGEKAFATHLGNLGISPAQIRHVIQQMESLNQEIEKDEANLGKGYRIGHSFFTPTAPVPDFQKWFRSIIRYEIMPLLEEYWIDDPKMVQQFRVTLTEGIP